jgi:hypothetical protein
MQVCAPVLVYALYRQSGGKPPTLTFQCRWGHQPPLRRVYNFTLLVVKQLRWRCTVKIKHSVRRVLGGLVLSGFALLIVFNQGWTAVDAIYYDNVSKERFVQRLLCGR